MFIDIGSATLLIQPYKALLFTTKSFTQRPFFSFYFHLTLFSWACGSLHEPQKFFQTFFLYIHLFVYHFFMDFGQICMRTPPMYICSTCHTIISLKYAFKLWYVHHTHNTQTVNRQKHTQTLVYQVP